MDDKSYKSECDRLSELETQNHTAWGRWFLDDGLLSTWVILPESEFKPVKTNYVFSFSPQEYHTKVQQESIIERLMTEDFIGDQGIHDLKRAFKFLNKRGIIKSDSED